MENAKRAQAPQSLIASLFILAWVVWGARVVADPSPDKAVDLLKGLSQLSVEEFQEEIERDDERFFQRLDEGYRLLEPKLEGVTSSSRYQAVRWLSWAESRQREATSMWSDGAAVRKYAKLARAWRLYLYAVNRIDEQR